MIMIANARTAIAGIGLVCAAAAAPVSAQDVSARVLGWYGNQPQSTELVRPFWEKIDQSENGLSVEFRTMDEIGLTGFEALRSLQSGAFDIESFQISFIGGEDSVLQGVDIPGLAFNFDELEEIVDVYKPVIEEQLGEKYDARLLAAWPFPFQIMFCKGDVQNMSDIEGKKVRVSGILTAELVEQLGGAAVTLAGPEVYQGLMQGVVDCAVTGSQFGNSNDWFEVTDTQIDMPIGGAGLVLTVARNEFWNALSDEQKTSLTEQVGKLEADLWEMAREGHDDGIRCNTGQAPCAGKMGDMTLVEPSAADVSLIKEKLEENVLPLWSEDCSNAAEDCLQNWNETIGQTVGLEASR